MTKVSLLQAWLRDERGVSALEFALLLPLALTLLLGTVDIGYALWLQRKVISATQSVADLLTREDSLNAAKVADAIRGAELILQPFSSTNLAYDVVGVEFRTDNGQPRVAWRTTRNMSPDGRFPDLAAGLGGRGEGVIGVVITYVYRPVFSGYLIGDVPFKETALLRGRRQVRIPYTS